jgi:hypothetical protein
MYTYLYIFIYILNDTPSLCIHAFVQTYLYTYIHIAPVSGGPGGALAGTLTIMIGGDEKTVKMITPFLECFGNNILHFGPIGSGMSAKLVNQALVGMHVQVPLIPVYMYICLYVYTYMYICTNSHIYIY